MLEQHGTIAFCTVPFLRRVNGYIFYFTYSDFEALRNLSFRFVATNNRFIFCTTVVRCLRASRNTKCIVNSIQTFGMKIRMLHIAPGRPSCFNQSSRVWRCWTDHSVSTGSRTMECPGSMCSSIAPAKVKNFASANIIWKRMAF